MADALLLETPARVHLAALHEAHRIQFNKKAFSDDADKKSIALTEVEWDLKVKVFLCWETGGEGLTIHQFRNK
jgi:hypothetical protein